MEKNEERVGVVSALGVNGEGIIKQDGTVVFVPFTLVGEKIRYKVLKVSGKIAYGKVLEILTPAEMRVRPECPVFGKCGGCQLQHVRYINQLKIKEETVQNAFKKVANIDVEVKPCVKGDNKYYYRNKLQLPVVETDKGTVIGFYAEGSHRVVPIDDCFINAYWTKGVIEAFKKYIKEFNLKGYDERIGSGDIREITVKEVKDKLIITVVSPKENIPNYDRLIELINNKVKLKFSLFLNVNARNTNVIYGDKFKLLHGTKDYAGDMLGIKYRIGVQSFMQVNNSVCAKLYSTVRELVDANENTVVIDAYSGAGLMTALLAKNAKKAIGIEIVPEAVALANELASNNGLSEKVSNYLGKCEDILPDIIAKERQENSDICLVLDPPRKGCDIKVLNAIIKSNIDKIVYVSCKPQTLARDVGLLVGTLENVNGEIKRAEKSADRYEISYLRPFDMFAQTKHVETIICLTRKD